MHVHELGGGSDAREIDLRQEYRTVTPSTSTAKTRGRPRGVWKLQQGAARGHPHCAEQQGRFTYAGGTGVRAGRGPSGTQVKPLVCRCESCVLKVTQLVSVLRPPHEVASCGNLQYMAAR